jgi:hypothetical protein
METLLQDIRHPLRTLRKSLGFALVAILTLALGIGASTAIFSVIENILMEPFPYPDGQRYMPILIHDTEQDDQDATNLLAPMPYPKILIVVISNPSFDGTLAARSVRAVIVAARGILTKDSRVKCM